MPVSVNQRYGAPSYWQLSVVPAAESRLAHPSRLDVSPAQFLAASLGGGKELGLDRGKGVTNGETWPDPTPAALFATGHWPQGPQSPPSARHGWWTVDDGSLLKALTLSVLAPPPPSKTGPPSSPRATADACPCPARAGHPICLTLRHAPELRRPPSHSYCPCRGVIA